MDFFKEDKLSALESIEYAQWIAFAPMVFQASRLLRDKGILSIIQKNRRKGISLENICKELSLPNYAVRVLLESGLGIGLVIRNDNKYSLTKTGHFLLSDELTKANMDFTHDVCYQALFHLDESLETGKPEGLKVLGNWPTVYEGLSELPEKVANSWFAFDHFYSDNAFQKVLPLVFQEKPKKLMDIGGNTGKWAISCGNYDSDVNVTIVDLPGQVDMAKKNIAANGLSDRISFHQTDLLNPTNALPKGHDAIWMSQFLDCFSDEEIISILTRCHAALTDDGYVFIMEPFWDKQKFKASAFSLQQTSLYFTAVANGNSQMYESAVFLSFIEKAGLEVVEEIDNIGVCQTLLKCKKRK
ncbi:class I SAM-dependent methyltransferase [uncultured Arcticibacterium sp.]|uniref:class I SAM-dependent methyltransferase n=1 Tax=uncultured Arcticibacterium sp. TaxID=2173042 RepID=UPI0030F9D8FA